MTSAPGEGWAIHIDNIYVYVGIRSKGLGKLISYIGISIEVWARVGENIGNFVIYKFY